MLLFHNIPYMAYIHTYTPMLHNISSQKYMQGLISIKDFVNGKQYSRKCIYEVKA